MGFAGFPPSTDHITWGAGAAVTATAYSIGRDNAATNLLHLNAPTGAGFALSINGVNQVTYTAGLLDFAQATSITTTAGALTLAPLAGQNLVVTLATTGDLVVNTNLFYIDTSASRIGIGTATPANVFHVVGSMLVVANPLIVRNASATPTDGPLITFSADGYSAAQGTFRFEDLRATQTTASFIMNMVATGDNTVGFHIQSGGVDRFVVTQSSRIGVFGVTPVARQTGGANLTNSVTSGGTDDTIANFTDLAVYANDAAAIRNDIYQLARTLAQSHNALRAFGWLT